jgi:hypothetical protein
LLYELYKYDYSLKKQYVSDKKIYSVDNGLRNMVSFRHSPDLGRLLENTVFIELMRRGKNVFFFKGNNECDFIVEKAMKITSLIQVCYSINPQNEEREISGLVESAKLFNLRAGTLITYDEEKTISKDGIKINMVAAWKWLLGI